MDEIGYGLMEIISILMNIALTAAAIIASYVGIKGLGAWRRQLRGNTEYTLAKNILTSMYELRESISGIRSPFMQYSNDLDLPPEKLDKLSQKEKEWHALAQAYQNRWEPVSAAGAKLRADLFEAEAVWGQDLAEKIRVIFGKIRELFLAIQQYLEIQNPTTPLETPSEDMNRRRYAILYEGATEPDEFKIQLDEAIHNVENELKPHITQHHN